MKIYGSSFDMYQAMKDEKIDMAQYQETPYMAMVVNLVYQLARIADVLESGVITVVKREP